VAFPPTSRNSSATRIWLTPVLLGACPRTDIAAAPRYVERGPARGQVAITVI